MDELPFMATEELIVRAVRAGGNRQEAHERIRRYSIDAVRAIKDGAEQNDLLDRIASDETFGITRLDLEQAMDPRRFVGRAPQQVDEFLEEVVEPLLAGASAEVVLEEMRV
jgi:adenylosuccinate lyase